MRIVKGSRVIAEEAWEARTLWSRLIGLIGRRDFPPGSALIIPRCNHIHTFGMSFPIDVLFVNADNTVLAGESLRPWRISKRCPGASKVIELPPGAIAEYGIQAGDEISLSD